jgi:hypothetical protein
MTKEIKIRLREIKNVLEYPLNINKVKLTEPIEKCINNIN